MDEYEKFIKDFYVFSGIDLSRYKRPQMERRLNALVQKTGYDSFSEFFQGCRTSPKILSQLLDKMTINVSEFFRNPDRWMQVADLLRQKNSPLRIWSAACSTGEEPYTLAIMMKEQIGRSYDIVASDIDDNVLAAAQLGLYKEHQMKSVPDELKGKCFDYQDGVWELRHLYRKNVTFMKQNLLSDRYPRDFDLIVCRNVLIYFTEDAKHHILSGFSSSLKPQGFLFVGSTEQIFAPDKYGLKLVKPFIYQKC